ncbi:hypothetical protein [Streptomyces chartreusis]
MVFTTSGLPSWDVVDTVVEILSAAARDTTPEAEISEFLRLWRAAAAADHALPAHDVTAPSPVTDRRAAVATAELLALECDATALSPGQALRLTYRVRMQADGPLPVMLGASLVGRDSTEYYDTAGDLHVTLTPGPESTYHRRLMVPFDTPVGEYRLVGGIWYPRSGKRRMAGKDRGYIVQIDR